ncbi:hypothetical protein HZS_2247, partial [Henneguya salminicola]
SSVAIFFNNPPWILKWRSIISNSESMINNLIDRHAELFGKQIIFNALSMRQILMVLAFLFGKKFVMKGRAGKQ